MDVTFVLCPNIIGLLCLTILLLFTRFNFYLDKRSMRLFVSAALVNVTLIVLEVIDYGLAESAFASAYLFRRFTTATNFALTPVFPLLIASICRGKKLAKRLYLPAMLNALASYMSCFTGHMFFISPENDYARGALFCLMLAASAFYLALLIYSSFKNFKSIRSSESVFILCIVAVILWGTALEIALAFHFVVWNCCAVLVTTYYLFLHIQYFKFDPLTNVYNRGMYNHEVLSLRVAPQVGVVSFDLNGLKKINDELGHEQGDKYLIAAVTLMERCFSRLGSLYRVGGDEFVVLIKGATEAAIQKAIDEFQRQCANERVSVACGYAFHARVTDASQMLRDADKRDRIHNT